MNNRFIIVVPLYNAKKWLGKCLKSISLQTHTNFECIMIDDKSTDGSYEIATSLVGNDDRFKIVRNEVNVGPLANVYNGAINFSTDPQPEDVVVIVDGDDMLAGKNSLKTLNEYYQDDSCWMTYGSYINLSNKSRGKFSNQIPEFVINKNLFREYQWSSSHLRSYKVFLLQSINASDLKNENGNFFKTAGDLAMMFPLLELSGHNARFVSEILYVWNDLNTLNEHKVKRDSQLQSEKAIRRSKKYNKLVRNKNAN
jgi:glycosyltransferase involved in cell wall biosynthesis